MRHFSIYAVLPKPHHMLRRIVIVSVALAPLALASAAGAQTISGEASDPVPRLKLAPTLEPPPPKAFRPGAPAERAAIFLRADTVEGDDQKWIRAEGKVELRTRAQTVLADWLYYDIGTDEFWGKGNVLMRRGVDWITGPEAKFKRSGETGFFTLPVFHIGENASRGDAREIIFAGTDKYELKDFRYTTCVAGNDDWYLSSATVDLDRSRLVGTARNATVVFKNVPILYLPYADFPLSNDRKSGFLTPVFGSTSGRGLEMSLPYYFNLAPNYDATLTSRLMTRRGLQVNGQFRYLTPEMNGEADAEVLPDRVTATNRYGLSWKHNQSFGFLPGLGGYVNVQKVSDDTYFADLSDRLTITSQTNLPRDVGLVYNRGPLSLLTRVQTFQTLQDPNQPITPPYFREPQVLMTMNPVEWHGLDFAANGEFVRFHQPALISGDRTLLYPTASWTRQGNAWFVTARTGLHLTHYDLDNPVAPEVSHLNRVLPITSVDGGLIYERDANYFGRAFVQTLEPRAFYVYIPNRRQDQIPAFDTAIDDFNFSQLFTENRYLGNDRIGDANQLTLAAVSRLLDPASGEERMRFAIGQRYYLQTQRVTLTETPRSANASDLLLAGEGRLSEAWSAAAALEYNLTHPQTERFDVGVRYQPGAGRVLNASYRYIRQQVDPTGVVSQLKQVDLSGQWPFLDNWSVIARWNYSLVDSKTLEGVVGFEYNGGCWAFRIVGQRLTTTTQQASTSVFVQFELNGLARLGTNPIDVLKRSVPGYLTVNDPSLRPAGAAPSDYFPGF